MDSNDAASKPTSEPVPDAPSRSGQEPDPAPEAPTESPTASAPPPCEPNSEVIPTTEGVKDETPAHITRSPSPKEEVAAEPEERTDEEAPHSPDPAPVQSPVQSPVAVQAQVPPVFTTHLPLTMVQTDAGQTLSARQLGQRARRARERELQAQGLYTPKRRTSSSATMPEPADVPMQSADEGDDDGEGELESDVPSVPPHSASHLIPPIAVLAPVTTPSRASLAQRARRERERATRLGTSPTGSPNGTTPPVTPIPFNPGTSQPPPTLTRGQLAQRARRARERVERAAKTAGQNGNPPGENWTPSLNSTEGGVSSAGEAVFAVAPPPPGYSPSQVTQSSPQAGYGVGLGAAHVPQQLNRAQLAQRARRARERQQRLATAATHSAGVPLSPSSKHARSDSGSAPPTSPSRPLDSPARTSLSPVASTTDAPAPLNINMQVFQSLTAGDNGVSRAVADSGAGVLTSGARTTSPSERVTTPAKTEAPKEESMDLDTAEENVDQLSEEPGPTPSPNLRPPTPPIQSASPNPPEVHRSAIQSVGA